MKPPSTTTLPPARSGATMLARPLARRIHVGRGARVLGVGDEHRARVDPRARDAVRRRTRPPRCGCSTSSPIGEHRVVGSRRHFAAIRPARARAAVSSSNSSSTPGDESPARLRLVTAVRDADVPIEQRLERGCRRDRLRRLRPVAPIATSRSVTFDSADTTTTGGGRWHRRSSCCRTMPITRVDRVRDRRPTCRRIS